MYKRIPLASMVSIICIRGLIFKFTWGGNHSHLGRRVKKKKKKGKVVQFLGNIIKEVDVVSIFSSFDY